MSDVSGTLSGLFTHPIKSCAGIALRESILMDMGLDWDRQWMVVDAHGEFLSQRELPRMALVQTQLRGNDLVLRAPGMLALHVALDRAENACRVRVWDDEVPAFDIGALAAQWFSDFLGRPAHLVRFDPAHQRLSSRRWTGTVEAPTGFADGFPILVVSQASLDELNHRLAAAGRPAVPMARFRPNIVLDGLQAHEEDFIRDLRIEAEEGPITLRLVKPCGRCSIPDVDPDTAATGHAVGDTLATYRADARIDGALSFGMNAVIVEGLGNTLRVGQRPPTYGPTAKHSWHLYAQREPNSHGPNKPAPFALCVLRSPKRLAPGNRAGSSGRAHL
jgi:uncharacterized protein